MVHSSTAQDPATPFKRIERRRKELKIGVDRLCALAGLHPNTYRTVRRGICPPRDGTLDKLTSALRRHAAGEKPTGKVSLCELTIRFLTAYLSEKVGADPVKVLATSFEAENTNDPEWLQGARLRRAAIYIAVEGAKMGKADVGGALGLTRQAVHKAVKDIEAQRDNNEQFDLLMQNALTVAGFK